MIGAISTPHGDAGVGRACGTPPAASAGCGRPGLDDSPQLALSTNPTETFAPTSVTAGARGEDRQVAQDQRSLRQDRERIRRVAQRLEDPAASAGTGPRRAGTGRRSSPSRCARPATPGGELAAQQLGRVDLHDDLRVEVLARVEVQVRVGVAREAVDAGVRASAVRVDRPSEGHPRGLGDAIDDRSRPDLVERDARGTPACRRCARRRPARTGGASCARPEAVRRARGCPSAWSKPCHGSRTYVRTQAGTIIPGQMEIRVQVREIGDGRWQARAGTRPEVLATGASRERCLGALRRALDRSLPASKRGPHTFVVEAVPVASRASRRPPKSWGGTSAAWSPTSTAGGSPSPSVPRLGTGVGARGRRGVRRRVVGAT